MTAVHKLFAFWSLNSLTVIQVLQILDAFSQDPMLQKAEFWPGFSIPFRLSFLSVSSRTTWFDLLTYLKQPPILIKHYTCLSSVNTFLLLAVTRFSPKPFPDLWRLCFSTPTAAALLWFLPGFCHCRSPWASSSEGHFTHSPSLASSLCSTGIPPESATSSSTSSSSLCMGRLLPLLLKRVSYGLHYALITHPSICMNHVKDGYYFVS